MLSKGEVTAKKRNFLKKPFFLFLLRFPYSIIFLSPTKQLLGAFDQCYQNYLKVPLISYMDVTLLS